MTETLEKENLIFNRNDPSFSIDDDVWDDSALIKAFDQAVKSYKEAHNPNRANNNNKKQTNEAHQEKQKEKSTSSSSTSASQPHFDFTSAFSPSKSVFDGPTTPTRANKNKNAPEAERQDKKRTSSSTHQSADSTQQMTEAQSEEQQAQYNQYWQQQQQYPVASPYGAYSPHHGYGYGAEGQTQAHNPYSMAPYAPQFAGPNSYFPNPYYPNPYQNPAPFAHGRAPYPPSFNNAHAPPIPPPHLPPLPTNDEALSNLLLAWYYSGYYAGKYQASRGP